MGMDANIYVAYKKNYEAYLERVKEYGDKKDKCLEYGKMLFEKYPELKECEKNKMRETFERIVKKEEVAEYDRLWKEYQDYWDTHEHMEGIEMMYWRKAWGLHWYIIEHCGDHNNDNCVNVILNKAFVEKLIIELKRYADMSPLEYEKTLITHDWKNPPKVSPYKTNPFGKDNCWDQGDVVEAYCFFETLLASFTEENVIYYSAWY